LKQLQEISCPAEITLSIIGGKWKPVIVWCLLSGTRRFGELQRLVPGATRQILTLQLRELEQAQVLRRQVYEQVPPKVEYSLTELGMSLKSLICQLAEWGECYTTIRNNEVSWERDDC